MPEAHRSSVEGSGPTGGVVSASAVAAFTTAAGAVGALVRSAAEQLGVKAGTPGLMVVRTSFDERGRVIEYDREYWRHDAIRLHVDINVQPAAGG